MQQLNCFAQENDSMCDRGRLRIVFLENGLQNWSNHTQIYYKQIAFLVRQSMLKDLEMHHIIVTLAVQNPRLFL